MSLVGSTELSFVSSRDLGFLDLDDWVFESVGLSLRPWVYSFATSFDPFELLLSRLLLFSEEEGVFVALDIFFPSLYPTRFEKMVDTSSVVPAMKCWITSSGAGRFDTPFITPSLSIKTRSSVPWREPFVQFRRELFDSLVSVVFPFARHPF